MGRISRKRGKSNLSRTAGNVEFFTIDGETYFKAHAETHKKSTSVEAVSGRSNFGSVVNLAKLINHVDVIKQIWNNSKLKGRNAYQKLIRYNMPLARDGNLTINNYFTFKGHRLNIPEFPLENNTLDFEFDVYGALKPPFTIHIIYYLYNRKEVLSSIYQCFYDHIDVSPENAIMERKTGDSGYVIKRPVVQNVKIQMQFYKDVVVLIAVTGTPLIAKRKYWTDTVGFDIPLV
jgi:hypothetical protein